MLPYAYKVIWSPTKRFLGLKTPIGHKPMHGGMWIVDMGLQSMAFSNFHIGRHVW